MSSSFHSGRQFDRLSGDHERAPAEVVNGARVFVRAVDPRFAHLEDEEVVPLHQARVRDFAFEVGVAFRNERSVDERRGHRRETIRREFVYGSARIVTTFNDFCRQLHCWNADDAFFGSPQDRERVIAIADHAPHERGFEFDHRVP